MDMHTEGDRLQTMSLSGDPQRTPRIQRRQNFGVLAVRTANPSSASASVLPYFTLCCADLSGNGGGSCGAGPADITD